MCAFEKTCVMLAKRMLAKFLRDHVCICARTRVSVSISVIFAVFLEQEKEDIRKRKRKPKWYFWNQGAWKVTE